MAGSDNANSEAGVTSQGAFPVAYFKSGTRVERPSSAAIGRDKSRWPRPRAAAWANAPVYACLLVTPLGRRSSRPWEHRAQQRQYPVGQSPKPWNLRLEPRPGSLRSQALSTLVGIRLTCLSPGHTPVARWKPTAPPRSMAAVTRPKMAPLRAAAVSTSCQLLPSWVAVGATS